MTDSDYIDLILPTRLSASQRQRMIASHNRLLAILNTPIGSVLPHTNHKSTKQDKEDARQSMKALHKQIVTLGGKVSIQSANYSADPTTGEITGVFNKGPIAQPAKPKSVLSATVHQVRIPLHLEQPKIAAKPAAAPTGIMAPLSREQALSGTSGPTTEQMVGAGQGVKTPATIITDPALAAQQETPTTASTALKPIGAIPTAVPPPPQATPVSTTTTTAKPTVPSDLEDLNADPLLAGLGPPPAALAPAQPAGPQESAEMMRLKKLLAEPTPPPPDTSLSTGQAAAAGFLIGLKPEAAGPVGAMIAGQRAEATQKYVMGRQEREATINNLVKIVSLQEEQARTQAIAQKEQRKLMTQAEGSAGEINQLHQVVPSVLQTALVQLTALDAQKDSVSQERASIISGQVQEVQAAGAAIQQSFENNPLAVTPEQVAFYRSRIDQLTKTVHDSMAESAKKIEQTKLPAMVQRDINDAQAIARSANLALAQMDSMLDVVGPFDARIVKPLYEWFSDKDAQSIGQFEALLAGTQAIVTAFAGRQIGAMEREVFSGFKLPLTLNQGTMRGRLEGIQGYALAKAKALQGTPGAQNEAERILAEAYGWAVVGQSGEGYPIWQSPQGLTYTEAPEAP